jgi:hypothetical protein
MNDHEHVKAQYETSKKFLKVQGVLSIVFGGLGTLFGIPLIVFYALGASYDLQSDIGVYRPVGTWSYLLDAAAYLPDCVGRYACSQPSSSSS